MRDGSSGGRGKEGLRVGGWGGEGGGSPAVAHIQIGSALHPRDVERIPAEEEEEGGKGQI